MSVFGRAALEEETFAVDGEKQNAADGKTRRCGYEENG